MDTSVTIDLSALENEIAALSPEQVAEQLLKVRTKQRIQQKKYQNTDAAKSYRAKRAATLKAMATKAKATPATKPGYNNLYEQIVDEANAAADESLGVSEAEETETV